MFKIVRRKDEQTNMRTGNLRISNTNDSNLDLRPFILQIYMNQYETFIWLRDPKQQTEGISKNLKSRVHKYFLLCFYAGVAILVCSFKLTIFSKQQNYSTLRTHRAVFQVNYFLNYTKNQSFYQCILFVIFKFIVIKA